MAPDLAAVLTINDFHKDSMKHNLKGRRRKGLCVLSVDRVSPDALKNPTK